MAGFAIVAVDWHASGATMERAPFRVEIAESASGSTSPEE